MNNNLESKPQLIPLDVDKVAKKLYEMHNY